MAKVNISVAVSRIRIQLDELTRPDGMVSRGVLRAAGTVRDRAKENITRAGLVDTGRLRNSITVVVQDAGGEHPKATVQSDLKYALYQHEGTANNGAGFIYPRRAQVLRFKGGSGAFVFAPRVHGVKATPFLTDALASLRTEDFEPRG